MALPARLQACLDLNVIVADSILGEVCNHLEFLGYTVDREGDSIFVSQPGRFSWLLKDCQGGILFHKVFHAADGGREPPEALMALSNRMNAEAVLIRTYVNARGDLAVEAWYPNVYERRSFGQFAMALETDLCHQLKRCRAEAETLLR